jgi:hypothetical protein
MLKYICLISVVSDLSHYLARFSKEVSSGASSRSVPFLNTKNLALNAYLLYGRHTSVEPIYIITNYEHQFESSAADVGYWISVLSPCTVTLKLAGHLATEHESSFEKNINASRYQYLSPPTKTSPSLSFQSLIRLIRKARRRDRFRTCSDRGCKAKAFAKSWAESMCRTWNRPVAPCPGPPLLACFADRWTITGERLDGDKRTALSLSARNRDGSTAPGESREIRYAAAHAAAFVTLRVARKRKRYAGMGEWQSRPGPRPTGEGSTTAAHLQLSLSAHLYRFVIGCLHHLLHD